jgi:hypothetical protein
MRGHWGEQIDMLFWLTLSLAGFERQLWTHEEACILHIKQIYTISGVATLLCESASNFIKYTFCILIVGNVVIVIHPGDWIWRDYTLDNRLDSPPP